MIEYGVNEPNTLSWKEIHAFLQETDNLIVPAISSRVSLEEYAKKLTEHAVIFSARDDGAMVGMSAVYYNPYPEYSYSTYYCVKEAYRKVDMVGIGLNDLQNEYWRTHYTKGIRYEIRKSNKALMRYHSLLGARIISEDVYPGTDLIEVLFELDFD